MQKSFKRTISILLSILMIAGVFAIVPFTASAEDDPVYVKVTEEPEDWSGEYLVVYEVNNEPKKVFNSAANLATGANTLQAAFGVSDGNIDYDDTTAAAAVTIAKIKDSGYYSIKTASGNYIGRSNDTNGIDESESALNNTIAWDNGSVKITSAGGAIMRYNTSASQFRYYKTATYTNQQPIQLYKLTGGSAPTYTVTWKNWDGSDLEVDTEVEKDTLPTYDGETPTKPEDEQNTYTFSGWNDGETTYGLSDTLPAVSGDITYTAVFEETEKPATYTITDESVNGTVTASVDSTDVTEAEENADVLLTVAPAEGYQFKSITAVAEKESAENLGDLIALMGDAVADGYDGEFDGYTFKVEDGKFVIYNGSTLFAELSESDVSDFQVGDDTYVESGEGEEGWYFTLSDNKITGFYWESYLNGGYFFTNEFESTGTLPLAELALTTVTEGSQYSFTMPNKPVTVKAEFEEAPEPATETIEYNFDSSNAVITLDDRCDEDGFWELYVATDDICVSLGSADGTEQLPGTYAWADMYPASCFVTDNVDTIVYFTDGSCTVTVDGEETKFAGTFTGDDDNTYVINVTYVPEAPATYTVTWKNWDGSDLEVDTEVEKDTLPTYDGETPVRPEDANNTYAFAAWDDGTTTYVLGVDDLPAVTADVTYTAVFTAETKVPSGLTFDADGEIRYYVDGVPQYQGLVTDNEGNYYYINSTKKAVKNCEYSISEAKANGLKPAGKYSFGADGKMIIKNLLTFDADGEIRYYIDSVPQYQGLVEDNEGNYYYINSSKKAVKNCEYSISEAKTNGLKPAGKYSFGVDGKMIIKNMLTFDADGEIRYYVDSVPQYQGLVKDNEGNYYYINSTKKAVKNCEYSISEAKVNGLMPAGKYTFGADGKMEIIE